MASLQQEGYSSSIFALTEVEERDLECAICLQLVRQATGCNNGHVFCRSCIGRWLLDGAASSSGPIGDVSQQRAPPPKTVKDLLVILKQRTHCCPTCSLAGPFRPFPKVDQKLNAKTVRCPNCRWTGKFVEYKRHKCKDSRKSAPKSSTTSRKRKASTSADSDPSVTSTPLKRSRTSTTNPRGGSSRNGSRSSSSKSSRGFNATAGRRR